MAGDESNASPPSHAHASFGAGAIVVDETPVSAEEPRNCDHAFEGDAGAPAGTRDACAKTERGTTPSAAHAAMNSRRRIFLVLRFSFFVFCSSFFVLCYFFSCAPSCSAYS